MLAILVVLALATTPALAGYVIEDWRGGSFASPLYSSINSSDGSVWLGDYGGGEVAHLAADGGELWRGNGFAQPCGVSVDPGDASCWIADYAADQVVHLAADGSELWRGTGFNAPYGLDVNSSDGSCWVADYGANQVVHLAPDGSELWRGGGFNGPSWVAVDNTDGSCWVTDRLNDQVVHLAEDGTELWRGAGFYRPSAVSVDAVDSSCWVADTFNHQVVHLAADGTELWRGGSFNRPYAVAVSDDTGQCWVTDTNNDQIVLLDSDGSELWRGGGFSSPMGLDATAGVCWVPDYGNGQIARIAWRFSVNLDATNGSIEVDGVPQSLPWSGDYVSGTEVVLEAIPDSAYEFTGWSGDLTGSENPTTVTVDSDMSITATFSKIQYTLDLSGVGSGTVFVDGVEKTLPWSGVYDAGTSVSLEASPGACYEFAGWSGDLAGSTNPTTIIMDANKDITASFSLIQHTLSLDGSGSGSVLVDGTPHALPWSGSFDCGTTVDIEAVPDPCNAFTNWSGDLSGSVNPTTITMDEAKSVTANFAPIEYTLSLDGTGNGSALVDGTPVSLPWSGTYLCGSSVTVEAVPDTCYEFTGWSGDVTGTDNPTTITMDGSKSVTAGFSLLTYIVTIQGDGQGQVRVDGVTQTLPWSDTVDCGTTLMLEAVPDSCWQFDGWSGDLSGTDSSTSLFVDGEKTVTATFSHIEYTLSLDGSGGSAIVDGAPVTLPWSGSFLCGSSVTVEAVPDTHREFAGWTGDLATTDNPASITIDGDKSVTANFDYVSYDVSVSGTGSGSILIDGDPHDLPWSSPFVYGASVTIQAVPDDGYKLLSWSGDVSSVANPLVLTVEGDTEVSVSFGRIVTFTDIPLDHWAYDAIGACIEAGIVSGYADGFYRPDRPVERAGMAVYIARGVAGGDENVPAGPEEPTFPDVEADYWAFDHIEYAVANNIVSGYGDGNYHPDWTVTRAQMAVFVARAIVEPTGEAGLADYTPPETASFTDVPTDYWCFAHVEYLTEHEIVAGYPDGCYRPTIEVTRDQMAVYVCRAFGLLEE